MSTIFSGSSRYSNDFTAVIDRAVAIASLPLQQMQQGKLKLTDEGTALTLLQTRVSTLSTAIERLKGTASTRSLETSSSNSSAVKATFAETASEGEYSVNVTHLGTYASLIATAADGFNGVADPATGDYTSGGSLSIAIGGDDPVTLEPANQTLQALVDEINSEVGTKVRAAIVNVSGTSTPSYALSLQAKTYGATSISLTDGARPTLTVDQVGHAVTYEVNGTELQSESRNVTLAPGVTLELKELTSEPVTVSARRSNGAFRTAITDFISAYNGIVSQIDSHRGNSKSPLSGNSVLSSVTRSLTNAINYQGGGSLSSLAVIGIEFDREGKLKLNSNLFEEKTGDNLENLGVLLGDGTSSGFIKSIASAVNSIVDGDSGFLAGAIETNSSAASSADKAIAREQARIDQLTEDLERRMVQADAAIAMLEQQASYFTGMFEAMRANQKSYS